MAVRSVRRSNLGKRSDYVYTEDSLSLDGLSSSGDETSFITRRKKKVRGVNSMSNLLRESHRFEKGQDHSYTQSGGCRGKRLRRDTENDEEMVSKKTRCENKNAINARINRERKKAYMASLEDEVEQLRTEKKASDSKILEQEMSIKTLKQEVIQLKSLLANNKYLSSLVSKLSQVTGLPVTSSLISKEEEEAVIPAYRPRTRCVPSGYNHPIAKDDVNFGSTDMDDPMLSPPLSDDGLSMFPSLELNDLSEFEPNHFLPLGYSGPLDDIELTKNFGICVHINQNRLSVEFCAECNARALTA